MSTKPQLLLAALILCCIVSLHVTSSMVISGSRVRCRCRVTTTTRVLLRSIQKIEIIPAGGHCRQDEVIITKRSGVQTCIDPKAAWLPELLKRLQELQRRKMAQETISSTTASPTSTSN